MPEKFSDTYKDPGFLVAKGRFVSKQENEKQKIWEQRDELLRNGAEADSSEVVEITRHIASLEKEIEFERKSLEKTHVKSLASAISMAISKCGYANIRAVGRNANYNAIKSITIAINYCKDKGISVAMNTSFESGNLGNLRKQGHVDSVTALMYNVYILGRKEDGHN